MKVSLMLEGYGIRLVRLTEDKIELVRHWRNDPKIARYMDYQEYITAEMQRRWFQKINNENNCFFIIWVGDKEIGLINIKNIDYEKGVGESGIFLWDDEFYGKQISYRARLVMLDFAFDVLHLQYIVSHVLSDNLRSQKSILAMGYKLDAHQENNTLQSYTLTSKQYAIIRQSVIDKLMDLKLL